MRSITHIAVTKPTAAPRNWASDHGCMLSRVGFIGSETQYQPKNLGLEQDGGTVF